MSYSFLAKIEQQIWRLLGDDSFALRGYFLILGAHESELGSDYLLPCILLKNKEKH